MSGEPGPAQEQVLWIERFETLAQLRAAVRQFAAVYNREWRLASRGVRPADLVRRAVLARRIWPSRTL